MDNLDSTHSEFESLVIRYLEGTISERELIYLADKLKSSDKYLQTFTDIRNLWIKAGWTSYGKRIDVDQAWKDVSVKLTIGCRRSVKLFFLRYVAIVILLLTIGGWLIYHFARLPRQEPMRIVQAHPADFQQATLFIGKERIILGTKADTLLKSFSIKSEGDTLDYKTFEGEGNSVKCNRLVTALGREYSVILADGTKVWLNACSELNYPARFSGERREVYLKGEAYFEVTKDSLHPFIVNSEQSRVLVLGTAFNMNCYEDELVRVSLVKGSVQVSDRRNQSAKMRPGEQAIFTSIGIEVKKVDIDECIGWRKGYFVYRDKRLDDILRTLARWYDFQYTYQNAELANELFTARLERFDEVETIFRLLEEAGHVKFNLDDNKVTISKK